VVSWSVVYTSAPKPYVWNDESRIAALSSKSWLPRVSDIGGPAGCSQNTLNNLAWLKIDATCVEKAQCCKRGDKVS
jgi:hypothetical protein